MADTAEMIRLMRHAAELLDACDPGANAQAIADMSPIADQRSEATHRAVREAAAIGTASMVLRLVAAAMGDDTHTEVEP